MNVRERRAQRTKFRVPTLVGSLKLITKNPPTKVGTLNSENRRLKSVL